MAIRTDLAAESDAFLNGVPQGVEQNERFQQGVRVLDIHVKTKQGAQAVGRPIGRYITLETKRMLSPDKIETEQEVLASHLKNLIPRQGAALVVGLGNQDITPDAFGPKTSSGILATRHFQGELAESLGLSSLRPVTVIAPGVLGQTGMEISEMVHALCRQIHPNVIIAIDALAARSANRLGTTIQISDTGIAPGSGVGNARKELSQSTLGVPVIAVGIPTVMDIQSIVENMCNEPISPMQKNMMVTPRDIDRLISKSAKLVAGGLNQALFPSLSAEELSALTSP